MCFTPCYSIPLPFSSSSSSSTRKLLPPANRIAHELLPTNEQSGCISNMLLLRIWKMNRQLSTCLDEGSTLRDYFFSLFVESQQLEFHLASYIPAFSPASAILKFVPNKAALFVDYSELCCKIDYDAVPTKENGTFLAVLARTMP
ncbi:hypothetical protein TcWFU_010245 [Taenia crassiceps]|uniref:Uncharacterized protein n=1 Tax=Taenia crassiceps TaxID=6207 RepID=A0ABR4Q588_9CEST